MLKQILLLLSILALLVLLSSTNIGVTKAEQSAKSPESGTTSRIKSLYDDLATLSFGSSSDDPDWGTYWNRIKTAAKWTPGGTAAVDDVLSGKTFHVGSRSLKTGTYEAGNLSSATVKNGTTFGVGQTGAYPSTTNPLSGDTSASDASASGVRNGLEAWDKTGALITGAFPSASNPLPGDGSVAAANDIRSGKVAWDSAGTQVSGTYPAPGACSAQQYFDNFGAPVTQTTNCVNTIAWTTPAPIVTGDDKQDPRTGIIWSQVLLRTGTVIGFSTSSATTFSWNTTSANNQTITAPVAGSRTATQLCEDQGNGWRLPTQKEVMQAYIDGSYFNLTKTTSTFWTFTEVNSTTAWYAGLDGGYTAYVSKNTVSPTRCVR